MNKQVCNVIKPVQNVLMTTIWFHFFILLVWVFFSIVEGFSIHNATPDNSFNAISHIFFWFGIEFLTIFVGAMTLFFDISVVSERDVMSELKRKTNTLIFWICLVILAMIANIIHITATAIELANCNSTLCISANGFLITFVIMLVIIFVLEIIELVLAFKYKNCIEKSLKATKRQ